MAWSMSAWTTGPTMGVLLYTHFGILAPHLLVMSFACILLALFWYYRLSDNTVIRPGKTRPISPFKNIRRFVAQPRLRLAWLIAFGRSCFWTTFFVYGPLLMVVTGQGKLAGGLLVSAGNALLFMAIFWGRAGSASACATRSLAFFAMSATLLIAGALWRTICRLLPASSCSAAPSSRSRSTRSARRAFMRAVRSYERPQMIAGLPHLSRFFRTDCRR